MTPRQARALRAASTSALTTLFAAAAHTLGGGGAPAPTVLLIAALLSLPVALLLTGRRAGAVRSSLAVLGSQAVYHLVFAVFGMSAAFAGPVSHVHGVLPGAAAAPATMAAMDASGPLLGLFEPTMLVMHALAAVAAILMLRHGERLLHAVAAMIWPALLRHAFRPLAVRIAGTLAARHPQTLVGALLPAVRGRGPPVRV
ncbi:hypothetical protein [Microbacterium mangrovi]|uniref:hypothetical protein n=1 Tax=Microbacterium mangrovi TaxID=1348253 RepID=UPI000B30A137|nr:hypothetical protein [Microbacterium mangrovi]